MIARTKRFTYDAFLSHRTGDGAEMLRDRLVAGGCAVWFDENRPLQDRRLFQVIRRAHAESRVTIAYLSADHPPSPWTVLEMMTSLRCERTYGIRCLFVYAQLGVFPLLQSWSLPEELEAALAEPERQLGEDFERAANLFRDLNHNWEVERLLAPVSRERCVARMRRAIDACRICHLVNSEVCLSPDLPPQWTSSFLQSVRLDAAMQTINWLNQKETAGDFQTICYELRCLEQHLSEVSIERTPEEVALLCAFGCSLVAFGTVNTRAEGMYILETIAIGVDPQRANRLMRWCLKREPDWCLIREFIPDTDAPGSQTLPAELPALEAALIESDECPPPAALQYVGRDVRLRLDASRQMRPEELPFKYGLELELHWLRRLTAEVRVARNDKLDLNTFESRANLQMIDVELAHRNLNALLGRQFSKAAPKEQEDALACILSAELEIVDTSESHDGAPMTSFASFFGDHLLPILALGILVGREPRQFELLGHRCCSLFARYTRADPQELAAYHAYWAACMKQRDGNGPGLAPHLLHEHWSAGFHAHLRRFLFDAQ